METPAANWEGSLSCRPRSPGTCGPRATVLGSRTLPGHPEEVAAARAFVTRTLISHRTGLDTDAAALLTSEIVTNAIQHTKSGVDGGTVTIVIIGVAHGVLVEVIDDGSSGTPVVKGDLYAAEGHGLFLVQHLAAQWGYIRDTTGTTVWFLLAAGGPSGAAEQADPHPPTAEQESGRAAACPTRAPREAESGRAAACPTRAPREAQSGRSSQLWAAAMRSATAAAWI
jgi:anti-sigma regulatory factor (Ser/Thr protein kinase)